MTKVLAISGSLRRLSYNTGLLRAVEEHAPNGVEVEIYKDLESFAPYNEDREDDQPESVQALLAKIRQADAVLIATPEFNTTLPGQLKHLVDWGSRPYGPDAALYGKPVAVVGASKTDYGAMWAQDTLRKALAIAGARVTDVELSVGRADEKFDADANLTDAESLEQLDHVVRGLVEHHSSVANL
ncbi:MAG TPA: NAD(P)H-dependent oxidoreductase [Solirubrobacteraceae bacterium]|nr:NAD(P)H-dependent oxidoreductase [Solirubrobacteraceae bacterium]